MKKNTSFYIIFLKVTALCLDNSHLFNLTHLNGLINLRWASFSNNYLRKIEVIYKNVPNLPIFTNLSTFKGIENCTKLEELTIENNYLRSLEGLETLKNLRKLNLSNNEISYDNTKEYTDKIQLNSPRLSYLAISNNKIKSLKFLQKLSSLLELNANFNQISNIREVFNLKQIPSLVLLDLWCNPMCHDAKYRLFVIYHLKSLKSLDGFPIESNECSEAREYFGGKLTCDFIAEKFPQIAFTDLRSLDLPQCSIRFVDLGGAQLATQQFENLRSLNLENNCLTSFSGLIYLKNLKTLCLNYNKIESIYPKVKGGSNVGPNGTKLGNEQKQIFDMQPLMESLEVLHLGYNGITDLVLLQVGRLVSLKALFLQGIVVFLFESLWLTVFFLFC
jgi:Leucine-rich repeat (LRR) protein